jgi:tRNA1(Val) A37 N6-methylase TrmN6
MSNKPYKPKPGDMEIRILNNGKVVMIIPDEELMQIARAIDPDNYALKSTTEIKKDVRNQTNRIQ